MTGAAVNGHCCAPPGRLGLAWLLDTVAKLGVRPVEQIDYRADNGGATDRNTDGRKSSPRPGSTAPRPDAGPVSGPGSC